VKDLQEAATAPVDLAQAVIGPGMAVFSQHGAVLAADGSPLVVGAALTQINRVLSEILDEQESDFDAATRFAIAWFEQHGTAEAKFGEADRLARAKNVAVNGLVEDGIIESRPGKVRLLARAELDPEWDPASDSRLTVWEITQHLVKRLEDGGDGAAADLLHRVGGRADAARELTYRLYSICERKGWTREAQSYNALAASWAEIQRLASEVLVNPVQETLGI
jgi:putative DNA methylase